MRIPGAVNSCLTLVFGLLERGRFVQFRPRIAPERSLPMKPACLRHAGSVMPCSCAEKPQETRPYWSIVSIFTVPCLVPGGRKSAILIVHMYACATKNRRKFPLKRACSPKFSQRCEDGKCEEGRCEEGRCEVLLATSIYTCFYLIILNLNNRIPNPLFPPRFIASIHVSAYCTQYAGYWTTSSITHTVVCVILKYPKYTVSAMLDFCKYPQVSNYPCVTRLAGGYGGLSREGSGAFAREGV